VPPSSASTVHDCVLRIFALTIVSPNNINGLVFPLETLFCVRCELSFSIYCIFSVIFIQQFVDTVGLISAIRLGVGERR
jgi:hypothetical protein